MVEEKFVEELKIGDKEAFKKLYNEYAPKIYGILRNYVPPNEIEDALQEVFLRILKGINNFEGRSKLSTWIYRIAVNVGKDYSKKSNNIQEKTISMENDNYEEKGDFQPSSDTNVQKQALTELNYELILNIMEKLNEDERLIIKLRDIDGLSYSEISEIMNIPIGTVKSKLHYARKKLRKLIEEEKLVWIQMKKI